MTTFVAPAAPTAPAVVRTSRRAFVRHCLAMLGVMVVSMMILGGMFWGIMAMLGHENLRDLVCLRAFVMTVNMAIGMTVWMRFRRHGWASTLEMDVAGLGRPRPCKRCSTAPDRRSLHELIGQLVRVGVAGPGSLTGRYPVGNTGRSNVPATRAMPVPDDLAALLAS